MSLTRPPPPATTQLPADPYRESRRYPADGSFRTALSKTECEEARRKLEAVKTLRDLEWYSKKYEDCLGMADNYNSDNRYYSSVILEHKDAADHLRLANYQVDRLLVIEDLLKKEIACTKDRAEKLQEKTDKLAKYLVQKMPDIRVAIRQQH